MDVVIPGMKKACDHKGMIVPVVSRWGKIPNPAKPGEMMDILVTVQAMCVNPNCRFQFKFGMPGEENPQVEKN